MSILASVVGGGKIYRRYDVTTFKNFDSEGITYKLTYHDIGKFSDDGNQTFSNFKYDGIEYHNVYMDVGSFEDEGNKPPDCISTTDFLKALFTNWISDSVWT